MPSAMSIMSWKSANLIQLHGEPVVVLVSMPSPGKNAAVIVHPIHATDDQPLQGQLRGDAHVHIDIQRVVVSDEGTGGSAAAAMVFSAGVSTSIWPMLSR